MRKLVFLISLLILTGFAQSKIAWASDTVVSSSANLKAYHRAEEDEPDMIDLRINRLKSFFQQYNSPLEPYADEFIRFADEYDIDWRLVPAITGVESTFGKHIPKGSFNAYGWANGNYKFTSWENSIETVTLTLRQKYYDRGADSLPKIGRRYAPPSTTWAWKVDYFMNQIDSTPIEFDL